MPVGGNLVQLTARSSNSGDSTRGKMMPSAPLSSARAISAYWRSATRTMGLRPASTETRQMSCSVSMSKPPCSASRKAQWNPAAARMRATSGERSWAKPQPSCVLPKERACLTGFIRMYGCGSDYQDTVVGARQVCILVQAADQIQAVLGEERED